MYQYQIILIPKKGLVSDSKSSLLAIVMEISAGFLRSSKVFLESRVCELKKQVYKILFQAIHLCPNEMENDLVEALEFFLDSRDPIRFKEFWPILNAELEGQESMNEKYKYLLCVNTCLNNWRFRNKDFATDFYNRAIKEKYFVQENAKLQQIMAKCLGVIIYRVFGSLRLDESRSKIIEKSSFPLKDSLISAVTHVIKQIDALKEGDSIYCRNMKLQLVYYLDIMQVYEINREQQQMWLLEILLPYTYSLIQDTDKRVTELASSTTKKFTKHGFSHANMMFFLKITQSLFKSDFWRQRNVGVEDYSELLRENWALFKPFDSHPLISMLYDPEIEVRNFVATNLAFLFYCIEKSTIHELIKNFSQKSIESIGAFTEPQNQINMHGSILGLISIVQCFGIEITQEIPPILSLLSKFQNNYSMVSKAVLVCLSDFWKRHKTTWIYVKHNFTEEQQQQISEPTNPYNYFAQVLNNNHFT